MQATAILSGIEGWLLNLEDGRTAPEIVAQRLRPLIDDLKMLHKVGMLNTWVPKYLATPEELAAFRKDMAPLIKALTGKTLEELESK